MIASIVRGAALFLAGALAAVLAGAASAAAPVANDSELATAPVMRAGGALVHASDGVVEAVRASVLSTQVPGRVTALSVKAGDTIRAGQVLARVDAQTAAQQAAASQAQVAAAQSQLEAAQRDLERNRRLYDRKYISQAAMDRLDAQHKVAQAQARATLAQAAAARTQTGLHTVIAPYAGIVAAVPGELGDMALPGTPLLEIYDPRALRIITQVPEAIVVRLQAGAPAKVEFSGSEAPLLLRGWEIMPTANPQSHTVEIRLPLPQEAAGLRPGQYSRVLLPLAAADGSARLTVPAAAVVRRTELDAVYVVDDKGMPRLRYVRLGRRQGERIEVLAGVLEGERVALDPLAAARAPSRLAP